MSDLIKREDVVKEFGRVFGDLGLTLFGVGGNDLAQVIAKAIPSAERKGEWIRTGRTNIYGGIEVQCSNCGDRVMVQHLEDEWFCRHCGADMGMKGADDGSC